MEIGKKNVIDNLLIIEDDLKGGGKNEEIGNLDIWYYKF